MSNFGRFGRDFNRQVGRQGQYRGYVPERDMHSRFTGGPPRLDDYHFVQRSGPRADLDNLTDHLNQVRIAAFQLEEMERLSLRENERTLQREIMEQEATARMCRSDEGYGRYGGEEHFRSQQLYHEPARAQPGPVFPLNQQNLRSLNGSGSRNSSSDQRSAFGTSQTSSTPTFQSAEPQRDRHPSSAGRQSPFWSSDLTQSSSRTSQTSSTATLQPNRGHRSHQSSSSHATTNSRTPNSSSRTPEAGPTPHIRNHQASSRPPTIASTSARTPRTSRAASSNHQSHNSGHSSTHESSRWEPMLPPETKDCIACLDPHPIDDFPPISPTCTHLPTLCTSCVQDALTATALNPFTINRLRCMHQGCSELLSHGDIRRLATPETFERYDYLSTRAALGTLENFMHCPNPACSSGQEHDDGVLFICNSCSHRFCVRHNMDWHEDETCAEYEERINPQGRAPERAEVRRGEDRETREVVERTSEGCPACGVRISKVDGCDHMSCPCGHDFCWLCLGDWPRGHTRACPVDYYAHLLR